MQVYFSCQQNEGTKVALMTPAQHVAHRFNIERDPCWSQFWRAFAMGYFKEIGHESFGDWAERNLII